MAIIVILCGAPHLYKKDMNNSGLLPFFIIFKKTKENNKFYILKTIALDRVEELEKRSAGIKEPE